MQYIKRRNREMKDYDDDEPVESARMSVLDGLIDLFFATKQPFGRRYPNKLDRNNKPITGPWCRWLECEDGARQRVYATLSPELVKGHLAGDIQGPEKVMLLAYQVDAEGFSVSTAIDLDVAGKDHADADHHFQTEQDALAAARVLHAEAIGLCLQPWIERTKSGGYRLWVFHTKVKSSCAHDLGLILLKKANLSNKVEVFPKQSDNPDLCGSGIFLPYYGPNREKGRQVMVDPQTDSTIQVWEFVPTALDGRTPAEMVERIVEAAVDSGEIGRTKQSSRTNRRSSDNSGSDILHDPQRAVESWLAQTNGCSVLKDIVDRAGSGEQLSYEEWLRLATHLKAYGGWGLSTFHELSEKDERYDPDQTDDLFHSLNGGPTNCDKMCCGLDPQDDCGLPAGRTNSIYFAYSCRLAQSFARADHIEQADWDYWKCTPDPNGPWILTDTGVLRTRITPQGPVVERVIGQPVYIEQRARDLDTNLENVSLVWAENGILYRTAVQRRTVSDSRAILELSNEGMMVNSGNARLVVEFIGHLLDYQQENIPINHVVSTCGYKEVDGVRVFLHGNRIICPVEEEPKLTFNPESDENGILSAYRESGNVEIWVATAQKLGEYPIAAFGVLAGFVAPFVTDLKLQQNPIIDFAGSSSTGKTTLLRFIASAWGYPPESHGGLIRSWNATQVFLERLSHLTTDLPIFLDECHNANPKQVQSIIYQYSNGTGRGRGTKEGGVQKVVHYKGVMFSAGEQRLADVSLFDGAQARILGFWGSPFGQDKAALCKELTDVAMNHYGLVGPGLVLLYLRDRDSVLPQLQQAQKEAFTRLSARATDAIGERLASHCAAIEAVGRAVSATLGLGWDVRGIVDTAYDLLSQNRKASSARASIELVGSWLAGRGAGGQIAKGNAGYDSKNQYVGRYLSDADGTVRVAILSNVLKEFLETHGYTFSTTISQWLDNGWLEVDKDRKDRKKVRFNNTMTYMIVLNREGMLASRGYGAGQTEATLEELGYEVEETRQEKPYEPIAPLSASMDDEDWSIPDS